MTSSPLVGFSKTLTVSICIVDQRNPGCNLPRARSTLNIQWSRQKISFQDLGKENHPQFPANREFFREQRGAWAEGDRDCPSSWPAPKNQALGKGKVPAVSATATSTVEVIFPKKINGRGCARMPCLAFNFKHFD